MDLKECILKTLIRSNDYISGEYMASQNNVSRNAVWKAINSLRKQGYEINAVQNKGYILEDSNQYLVEKIKSKLLYNQNVEYVPTVTSTNDLALEYGKNRREEGTIIIANNQIKGRGRYNREFFSPAETGIYFSILLYPNIHFSKALFITTSAAVAVCGAFEKLYGIDAQIKWVNDIFINNKKVCGILTEAHINMETSEIDYAVLGIGINLFQPKNSFPDSLSNIAGAVFNMDNQDDSIKINIVSEIVNRFWENYKNLEKTLYLKEYIDRSLVKGKYVLIEKNNIKEKAYVLGITDDFKLYVEYGDGKTAFLDSGEVSLIL